MNEFHTRPSLKRIYSKNFLFTSLQPSPLNFIFSAIHTTTSFCNALQVEAMATTKITANTKTYKPPSSKSKTRAKGSQVPGARNALPTARLLHFNTSPTMRGSRSPPAPTSMPAHVTLRTSGSQRSNKMTIMPTPKLIQAIQNLGTMSKPLQVKVIKRNSERDEDTSSYESDSSGDTMSMGSPLRPNIKSKGRDGTHANDMADISLPPQEAINASQVLRHQAAVASEFPGVPIWFPVKIKRILVDEGCPNALPFKVSNAGHDLESSF